MFFEKFKLDTVLRFLISRRVESSHSLEACWNSVYRRVFGYRNWEPSNELIFLFSHVSLLDVHYIIFEIFVVHAK